MSTRRDFVKHGALAGAGLSSSCVVFGSLRAGRAHGGIGCSKAPSLVSFFWDQPYVDYTGLALPYEPPRGLRSGQAIAHLSEEALRRAFGWI
jgi:hypothetical protein